jgi:rSAM/selenodomain-associated transferase 2
MRGKFYREEVPSNLSGRATSLSIIVPVLYESETINGLISHLRSLPRNGTVEIIVVDGDPQGSTVSEIMDREVLTSLSEKGRARQMNRGARTASGEILLFLHADAMLPNDALLRIGSVMNNPSYGAGAFELGISSQKRIFRITEKYVALRTRLTRVPFGDQALFFRKSYFELIGGFDDIPLMEDVELMRRIRRRKDRICIIPEKVITSPRRWEREGIFYCTLRNWLLQALYAGGVSPERLARWYRY